MSPSFPVEVALGRICGQHRDIARVLKAGDSHVDAVAEGRCPPDFSLLAAVLAYVTSFCHGVHHSAEELYLFSAMEQSGAPVALIHAAVAYHEAAIGRLVALQRALASWRDRPARTTSTFLELAPDFIACELDHMSYEENSLLPCAVDNLPASFWEPIAQAFRCHADPLFGTDPAPELVALHHLRVAHREVN